MTQAYPLQWPDGWARTPAHQRGDGFQFKKLDSATGKRSRPTFAQARDRLMGELSLLGAKNVVISTNHPADVFGKPVESKRAVGDEGVAVYFTHRDKPLSMARDAYTSAAANMTSLALAIEAMRQLERHGGGQMMEKAFAGFLALPPPMAAKPKRPWRHVMGFPPDLVVTPERASSRFRMLAKDVHPDKGGTAEEMSELTDALKDALAELVGSA